jgi:hypothetical protein
MAYKCHVVEIYYHVKQILSCYYVETNVTKFRKCIMCRNKCYQMRSHVTMADHSVIIYYVKHMLILGTKSCYQAKLSYLFYLSQFHQL